MKTLFTFCVLSVGLFGVCQNGFSQSPSSSPEEVIRHALDSSAIDGHMEKQLSTMGDAAAVSVTKVIAERPLSGNDIKIISALLRLAFTDPNVVTRVGDREPRTTLFVLRFLEQCAQNSATRNEINDTKAYVEQQFRRYQEHR